MEWNREAKSKAMCIWSTNLQNGYQEHTKGKDSLFNKMMLGKLYIHIKNETKPLFHIVYKNKLKWVKDLNVRLETKATRRKQR